MEEIQRYLESLSQRPELNRISGYTVHPAVDAVLTAMLARGAEAGSAEVKGRSAARASIPTATLPPADEPAGKRPGGQRKAPEGRTSSSG